MRDFVFLQSRPKAPLSCHVESLWYARGTVPYRRERLLPNGRVVLLINLGDPLRQEGAETGNFLGREAWISGLQSRYTINEPLGETHVAGVTFRPTGATAFFAPPMAEFSDRLNQLSCLMGIDDVYNITPDISTAAEGVIASRCWTCIRQRSLLRFSAPKRS